MGTSFFGFTHVFRSELSSWEEKISMKKKFKEKNVPFIKSFYEAYQPFSASDLAIAIKNAAKVVND